MLAPIEVYEQPLNQSLGSPPHYAGRTMLQLGIAFGISLAFALLNSVVNT
jgi:hypothetical protein